MAPCRNRAPNDILFVAVPFKPTTICLALVGDLDPIRIGKHPSQFFVAAKLVSPVLFPTAKRIIIADVV